MTGARPAASQASAAFRSRFAEDLPEEHVIAIDRGELAGGRDGRAGWQLVLDVVGCPARHALEVHGSN